MAKKKLEKKSSRNAKDVSGPSPGLSDKKKNTSLRLDKQTLKALKIRAIEQDTIVQNLIETLIKNYLDGKN